MIHAVFWPGQKTAFSVFRALIVGVILGSNLRPYQSGLLSPPEIQLRVLLVGEYLSDDNRSSAVTD